MIYTPLTLKALRVAYYSHLGQMDYGNIPYIFHPYHLAEQMDDETSCAVALLHDTIEDTDMTIEALRTDFPQEVTDAVLLLTHDRNVDYYDYINALKQNPIARKVKLADLDHNSDETRLISSNIPLTDLKRRREKYNKAKQLLLQ